MGTPHAGADKARWGSILTSMSNVALRNPSEIVHVLDPGSEVLANLQQEFHTLIDARERAGKTSPMLFCFFEELPKRPFGMVTEYEPARPEPLY